MGMKKQLLEALDDYFACPDRKPVVVNRKYSDGELKLYQAKLPDIKIKDKEAAEILLAALRKAIPRRKK